MASMIASKNSAMQARAPRLAVSRRTMPAKRSVTTRFKIEEAAPSLDIEKGVIKPGSVCIITGGSRGIGREIALALASAGQCRVVINHLPQEKQHAQEVMEVVDNLGAEALCIEGNVAHHEDMCNLVQKTVDKWGQLDVLVNNAGVLTESHLTEMDPSEWRRVIDINLTGTFYACKAALKVMADKKAGRIVNIASMLGVKGDPVKAHYAASKAGMIGLTKSVAAEYAHLGITCNAVAPGFIQTEMLKMQNQEVMKEMPKHVPMGRFGDPSEVAGLVRYLALDPSAAYITGQTLLIDGGMCRL